MEPLFEILLTGTEVEALLADAPDEEALASARAKLAAVFTIIESAGGC